MNSMFELLMGLPLFQGVSYGSIARAVGDAKFHFMKFQPGETVIRADEHCKHITFVLSGAVRSVMENIRGDFAVSQLLRAPAVLSPDFLFGRVTVYPTTVTAVEPTGILRISKSDYIKILNSDEVFLFNYLNLLSVNAQKAQIGLLSLSSGRLDERLALWISAMTQKNGEDIRLICRSCDLCSLFGTSADVLLPVLEELKRRGIADCSDTELIVRDRAAMLSLLHHPSEPYGNGLTDSPL